MAEKQLNWINIIPCDVRNERKGKYFTANVTQIMERGMRPERKMIGDIFFYGKKRLNGGKEGKNDDNFISD